MELTNTVALVTGAGGKRLGRSFALALARKGASVAVHYNSSLADAMEVVDAIRLENGKAEAFKANLAQPEQIDELVKDIRQKLGNFSVLINSASIFGKMELPTTKLDEWDQHFAVNLRAPFLLAQAMLAGMPPDTPGKVINIGDWHTANPTHFAYGVSKAGLSGLTRSLAVSMAPHIQVNQVALGAILPPAGGQTTSDEYDFHGRNAKMISNLRLCKRLGSVEEVSQLVETLVENDYITGQTINITGGVDVW